MKVPVALALAAALAGCSVDMGGFSFVSDGNKTTTTSASVRAATSEAVVAASSISVASSQMR